ncbi:hypothetical protein BDZ97DRAFT_1760356 [Flammula alnicola]|nr:hypothetical protein BDZ97DRAFT_1760356 [Flammula alnicola]
MIEGIYQIRNTAVATRRPVSFNRSAEGGDNLQYKSGRNSNDTAFYVRREGKYLYTLQATNRSKLYIKVTKGRDNPYGSRRPFILFIHPTKVAALTRIDLPSIADPGKRRFMCVFGGTTQLGVVAQRVPSVYTTWFFYRQGPLPSTSGKKSDKKGGKDGKKKKKDDGKNKKKDTEASAFDSAMDQNKRTTDMLFQLAQGNADLVKQLALRNANTAQFGFKDLLAALLANPAKSDDPPMYPGDDDDLPAIPETDDNGPDEEETGDGPSLVAPSSGENKEKKTGGNKKKTGGGNKKKTTGGNKKNKKKTKPT